MTATTGPGRLGVSLCAVVAGLVLGAGVASAVEPAKEFRIIWAGGITGDYYTKAFIEPFEKKTGTKVTTEAPAPFGKLRAMVAAGKVTAALFDAPGQVVEQAVALGLVEPIDWAAVKPYPMFEEAKHPYAFGTSYYSTIMAWRKGVRAPSTWKEFWDVTSLPGKRALADYPEFTLPIALLADGVSVDKLFPLDLDRAFTSLKKIGKHVIWWTAGSQPAQLLNDNEVQYAMVWNGRVAAERNIEFSFNQGLLDIAFFVVPKGVSPAEKAAAMLLLHEHSDPNRQLELVKLIPYPGPSPELFSMISDELRAKLPTSPDNKARQVLQDNKWWFKHAEDVQRRWQEFKLSQ